MYIAAATTSAAHTLYNTSQYTLQFAFKPIIRQHGSAVNVVLWKTFYAPLY